MRKFTPEHIEKLRKAHLGVKLAPAHRAKVIKTLNQIKKGMTYEEAFGIKTAKRMKAKMRLAKLGKKMPWNSVPSRRGTAHPRWIKDRTKVIGRHSRTFHDPDYKRWRVAVCERDNFKCQLRDKNCKGRLEVHHILVWKNYPELRYKLTNGITLCHAHHPRSRAKEKRLISLFKKLVSVTKG